MSESHELHQVQVVLEPNFGWKLAWRDKAQADAAYEAVRSMREDVSAERPIVTIGPDDFGNRVTVDARQVKLLVACTVLGTHRLNNELAVAQTRAQVHGRRMMERDPELVAALRGGNSLMPDKRIVNPNGGGVA